MPESLQFKARSSPGVEYIQPGGVLWRIIVKESLFAEVEVVTKGLSTFSGLTSSDSKIVKHIYLKSGTAASNSQVFEFYALNQGHVRLEATFGGIDYHLDVEVKSRRGPVTILKLDSALAVMNEKPIETIHMAKLLVPDTMKPADVVKEIAKTHVRHLFFDCHRDWPKILDIAAAATRPAPRSRPSTAPTRKASRIG